MSPVRGKKSGKPSVSLNQSTRVKMYTPDGTLISVLRRKVGVKLKQGFFFADRDTRKADQAKRSRV
jgi:hypothetical protein